VMGLLHSLIVAITTSLILWRPSFAPIRDMFGGRMATAIASEALIYFGAIAVIYARVYAKEAKTLASEREVLASRVNVLSRKIRPSETLAVPASDGLLQVPVNSIDWVQAEDNYVRLHTAARSHLVRTTLTALESKLADLEFVRIHRSAMVNVPRIVRLKRVGDRCAVVLTNGTQLRVSRAYRKRLELLLHQ
jgi:two-component system LytT family response regulator